MSKVTVIKPKKTVSIDDLKEIWAFKELLYFFVWRDLKVRYKQTAVGVMWAIFQPFIAMVVFSIVFGRLAHMPSDGVPYPIFVYSGLLFWQFFSSSLSDVSNSLIANQSIVTKVYFPRLLLPIAAITTNLVDFFVASVVLVGLMFYYGFLPHLVGLLIIPLLLGITFLASLGGGLFLASINVKYRDIRYILPYFLQMLLFITPVIYPASIAGKYSWILAINPMTGVIKAARAAVLGTEPLNWFLLELSLIAIAILLAIGVMTFKKMERYFADII